MPAKIKSPPAEIEIEVTAFKNIFTTKAIGKARSSGHKMKMKKKHSLVYVKADEVHVMGATKLTFTLKPANFVPIGIAFKLLHGITNPDAFEYLGLLNFEKLVLDPDNNSLTIMDNYLDKDGKKDDTYEFSIVAQNTDDSGAIGIIDPPIIHESN